MGKEWFNEWFDENYLLIYKHRNIDDAVSQFKLIVNEVKPEKDWKILDLACGEGRHASLFKDSGYNISGLDLSETLIKRGENKFPGLKLEVCDMRNISGNYNLILSLFTSFGYFDEEKEDRKVISSVSNALLQGGIFWFDFLNPFYVKEKLINKNRIRLGDGVEVVEERTITGNRVEKKITFIKNSGIKVYYESVRMYSTEEVVEICDDYGMKLVKLFGDYKGSKWTPGSERAVYYFRKVR